MHCLPPGLRRPIAKQRPTTDRGGLFLSCVSVGGIREPWRRRLRLQERRRIRTNEQGRDSHLFLLLVAKARDSPILEEEIGFSEGKKLNLLRMPCRNTKSHLPNQSWRIPSLFSHLH